MTPGEPRDFKELRKRYPGAVVDEARVAEIRARQEYAQLPRWRRILRRAPKGWR